MGGVFGAAIEQNNAQTLTYYALYALQHRGQYGCGIASNHMGHIDYEKGHGLVTNVLHDSVLQLLRGKMAIGHVSNSQQIETVLEMNPKVVGFGTGAMGLVFDGYLLNYDELKAYTDKAGVDYENTSHPEVVANLIALHYDGDIVDALRRALKMVHGAYSILLMTEDRLIGVRDRYGIKPLIIGQLNNGYMFSSETCAFDAVSGEYLRDVGPGEMIVIESGMPYIEQLFKPVCSKSCIFEVIYYARPDSMLNGSSIYRMRINSGKLLARRNTVKADLVIGAPDSGTVAAVGFAEMARIPYGVGIIKNRYVGRTFIERERRTRIDKVRIKLNVLKENIDGKDLIVVDDSIVRGTTMARTVKMLRDAGAKSVHVRIASPVVNFPCEIGVNQSVSGEMLASKYNIEQIRKLIEADSLEYMTVDEVLEAYSIGGEYCTGCLNHKYPIEREVHHDNGL